MALPTIKPTDHAQIPERRHSDPPALWFTVILGSLVIHWFAFGMLLLLMRGRLQGLYSSQVIPVEVISVASKAASPAQPFQSSSSAAIRNPNSVNTPARRTSEPFLNRRNPSVSPPSTRTDSPLTRTQQPEAKLPSAPKTRESQSANASPNQPPAAPAGQNLPNPSQNQPPAAPAGQNLPNPSQNQPPAAPTGQNSSNSQQGGGFIATTDKFGLTNNNREVIDPVRNKGDKLATPKPGNRQSFSKDYLKSLGITLDQVVVLQVIILIETTGEPTVLSTQVQQGNISADKADRLAREIIKQWQFEPTYMAGSPVPRDYSLPLTINPLKD
jgi:hypothetical protein